MKILLSLSLIFLSMSVAFGQDQGIPKDIRKILERSCSKCHDGEDSLSGMEFDVADLSSMIEDGVLVSKSSENSSLFTEIESGGMPEEDDNGKKIPVSETELRLIKAWIDRGMLGDAETAEEGVSKAAKAPKPNESEKEEKKPEAKANSKLASEASAILKRNCYRCHMGKGSESGFAFDVTDLKSMLDDKMIIAGNPKASKIFREIDHGSMPPRNRPQLPRPSPKEARVIADWVIAGADQFPPLKKRPSASLKAQLTAIKKDLQSRRREDRINMRYFTLTHLHNDITVDNTLLETTRYALDKTLNSLSWESLLVTPEPIDEFKTVYAIDISKLGWSRLHWSALAAEYPYGVSYGGHEDPELQELHEDIRDFSAIGRLPIALRADWIVAVATKPRLYHKLVFELEIPALINRAANGTPTNPKQMTDVDLEGFLGVKVLANIKDNKVWRSGFTHSGVSGQNRMIERHSMKSGGYYWKSYDFLSSNRTAILSEFPLGPKFGKNPFSDLAFKHDGGEIIFSLPNGLQGYMLVDAVGNRIDAGPIEVVADSLKTSGNEQIVVGLSCIACHRKGMIEAPNDEVRKFSGAFGEARKKVQKLYPKDDEFRKLVSRDREAFLRTISLVASRYTSGANNIELLPEPVGELARRYHLEPMKLETVAAELYVSTEKLRGALENDPRLKQFGMRILLRNSGTIKRAAFESSDFFPFVARQFGYDAL